MLQCNWIQLTDLCIRTVKLIESRESRESRETQKTETLEKGCRYAQ